MAFLTDEEKGNLTIERMIFHIVGPDVEEPQILDEIAPPEHTDFFVGRIRIALGGNLFEFKERSPTEATLKRILADPAVFAESSSEMARDFHSRHITSASNGVFFLFQIRAGQQTTLFALIKYDIDDVVHYKIEARSDGHNKAKLQRLNENFVKKPEAMQKVALIRFDDGVGKIAVRDRSQRDGISDYFAQFLYAKRVNNVDDMSGKLAEAFKETFRKHREDLPESVRRNGMERIFDALRSEPTFDPENLEPLVNAAFGPLPEGSPIRKTLGRSLDRAGLSEESFTVNANAVPRPRKRQIRTNEGVQIIFDQEASGHTISRTPMDGGGEQITITTSGVTVDDAEPDDSRRRR
ncbi:nucleoid-associated protein [Methylocystis heyeri]|nr:nucleoid-associated protein [Methylocystis heyeri]